MYEGDIRPGERKITLTETIEDFMDEVVTKPATVSIDATLRDAIDAILASGVTRKAYVLDAAGALMGTISVETLMRHVADRLGARPPGIISWFRFIADMESDRVADFMAKPIPLTKKTRIVDVVNIVVSQHLNDFPVVDDEGRLIGEVNSIGLLRAARSTFSKGPAEPRGQTDGRAEGAPPA